MGDEPFLQVGSEADVDFVERLGVQNVYCIHNKQKKP